MRYVVTPLHSFLFPTVVWRTGSNGIHLTFDDGPHPIATPRVLDILKEHDIRATFFLIGKNVQRYPDLVRRIHAEGHRIGNHTNNHRPILFRSRDTVSKEIITTQELIHECIGYTTDLFRPPYGLFEWFSHRFVRSLKYQLVMWTLDSGDFGRDTTSCIVQRVCRSSPGSIVLMHDNERTQSRIHDILKSMIEGIQNSGLTIDPLPL
jgi:peptidoglycan-N-acetylglucosamine deacetylase